MKLSQTRIDENAPGGTLIGRLSGVDPDEDAALTYEIVADADGKFDIVDNKLVVKKGAVLDFESKTSHQVTVRVSDGTYSFEKTFTIYVNNLSEIGNDAPTDIMLSATTVDETLQGGGVIGLLSTEDFDIDDVYTYTILNDPDGKFQIVDNELRLKDGATFDFESKTSHTVTVLVVDSGGLSYEKTFTIKVNDVNEPPTSISLSSTEIDEDMKGGDIVGVLGASDPDSAGPFTYSIVGPSDLFVIVDGTLRLKDGVVLDHESQPTLQVTIRVSDGTLTYDQTFTITVRDVNEAPVDIVLSNAVIAENSHGGTNIGQLFGDDPDSGSSFTYTIVTDPDSKFQIVGDWLQVREGAVLDYETNATHQIVVRVSDGELSFDKIFTIHVSNVNEAPTDISLSSTNIDENKLGGTLVGLLSATDADTPGGFTYAIIDDPDRKFQIVDDRLVLRAGATLDFERKASHEVTIRVSDGQLFYDKTFIIQVNDVPEDPANRPPTDITLLTPFVAENAGGGTYIGSLAAIDPDAGNEFTYEIVEDPDGRFELVGNLLRVRSGASFDYETKAAHQVVIRVMDQGGLAYTKVFTIAVTDVNERPTDIILATTSIDENRPGGSVIGTLTGVDPDFENAFTYAIINDPDGKFQIVGNTLQVKDGASLDFEAKSSHSVTIRIFDRGGLSFDKTFTILVHNVNEAPTGITLSATGISESSPPGTIVGTLSGIDPDAGNTFSYEIVNDPDGKFQIVNNLLQLRAGAVLDYETKSAHQVTVRVIDQNGLSFDRTFTIAVGNAPEPVPNSTPVNITLTATSVSESALGGTVIGKLSADDPDAGNTFTYTIFNDPDSKFQIVGNTLQLRSGATLDFEAKAVHQVTVRVKDQGGLTYDKIFYITVGDANERPTDILLSTSRVNEDSAGNALIGMLTGVDPDAGNTFRYTIVDDPDGKFQIVGNELRLRAGAVLDYEKKASHQVTVRVIDQNNLFHDKTFTISVNDVDETPHNRPPIDVTLSTRFVMEGSPGGTVIGLLAGVDPDVGDRLTYVIVDDPDGKFQISNDALVLKAGAVIDYETKSSHQVTVRAIDRNGLFVDKIFYITGGDANERPTDILLSTSRVDEDSAGNALIGMLTGVDPDAGNAFNYAIVDDPDGKFQIVGNELRLRAGAVLDYEKKASHQVTIRVIDQNNLFHDKTFTISVNDVDETPHNRPPTDVALSTRFIMEGEPGGTVIGLLTGVDPDVGDRLTYVIVDDPDGKFQISNDALVLKAGAVIDYETKSSHQVTVRAIDRNGLFLDKIFTIAVHDVNEAPIELTLSNSRVDENALGGTEIGLLSAVDHDAGDDFTYEIVDDPDGKFQISGGVLQVRAGASLDFESKASHQVKIRALDQGHLSYERVFTIRVSDLNEAPSGLTLSSTSVKENVPGGTTIGILHGIDQDAASSATYEIVSDPDEKFQVVDNLLQVRNGTALNYETQASHQVTVRVKDQYGLTFDQTFTIVVQDISEALPNRAPSALGVSNLRVYELTAKGTEIGTLVALDADEGDTLTFSIADDGAAGRFMIEGNRLLVADGTKLDYEQASSHQLRIRVTDKSGAYLEQSVTVTVLDVSPENVTGGASDDTFIGGAGRDNIAGGSGNDKLYGRLGADTLSGGAGRDIFVFDIKPGGKADRDKIVDYRVSDDSIYLDNAIFRKLGKGSPTKPLKLNKNYFVVGEAAQDSNDYLIYNPRKKTLYYDADGSGPGKAVEIFTTQSVVKFTASEFFVI
nr:cadherin domain-containing protein [Microvirga terricola]